MNFSFPSSSHFLFLFFFYFLNSSFPVSFSLLFLLPPGLDCFSFFFFLSSHFFCFLFVFFLIYFFLYFLFLFGMSWPFFQKKKKNRSYVVDLSWIYQRNRLYFADVSSIFLMIFSIFFSFSRTCTQISIYSLYFEPIYELYIDDNSDILSIFLSTFGTRFRDFVSRP